MPVQPTYPGVYVQEVSSGVKTITGVSTSVCAFVGTAIRGPNDTAVNVLSFSDFERRFGGLLSTSAMTYAVRQFFNNGGTNAWIVRIVKNPLVASLTLQDSTPQDVLTITAMDKGSFGNSIEVRVDYKTSNPGVTFNLGFDYVSTVNPGDNISENYFDLSMDSSKDRYVEKLINDVSKLVKVEVLVNARPVETPEQGKLTGEAIAAVPAAGSKIKIGLDGYGPDEIDLSKAPYPADVIAFAARIQDMVRALKPGNPSYANFTCIADGSALVLSSGSRGAGSSVQVTQAAADTLAADLMLTTAGAVNAPGVKVFLENGHEDTIGPADLYNLYIGSLLNKTGIYALEDVDIFNLLCLPGIEDAGILMDADAYCQGRRAFMIVDAPESAVAPAAMKTIIAGASLPKTEYAAVYYPWISIADPLNGGKLRSCPPSGTIAGLYARTDSNRGVWKAPAGTEATLTGVQKAAYNLTDGENGTLNPLGVNCIRVFPVFGAIAWGARTLRGADQMTSEYKYVPVRRLALFLEESLYRGLKWVVFEPNDEPLWSQIRLNAGAFMHNLFIQGAFQGQTPKDAYFVKCDKETTTQNDINLGIVNIWVGFAPLKPAEFVILHIQQMAGNINQ